ncbi:MAG: LysE family transporter [Bacteroidaceae bacterium]|nr:LysE family transporter [Bacteroidaceae bacterium]MBQ3991610.1 LysE family transporter [Bacteroidaceae bacterium]
MFLNPLQAAELFIKGLIVGIIASAPMGPVGILVVQRTLNKGRWHAFVTGLGAAVSDLLYALFTALGMSLAMALMERNRTVLYLKLAGAVMLFVFGLYTYLARPAVRPPSKNRGTLAHNMLTGFAVTLSNPLIIFLFVALFARFDFVESEFRPETLFGFAGIVCGALLWWFCLTGVIDHVRTRFQMRNIVWLNHAIGALVMTASLVGLAYTLYNI